MIGCCLAVCQFSCRAVTVLLQSNKEHYCCDIADASLPYQWTSVEMYLNKYHHLLQQRAASSAEVPCWDFLNGHFLSGLATHLRGNPEPLNRLLIGLSIREAPV